MRVFHKNRAHSKHIYLESIQQVRDKSYYMGGSKEYYLKYYLIFQIK